MAPRTWNIVHVFDMAELSVSTGGQRRRIVKKISRAAIDYVQQLKLKHCIENKVLLTFKVILTLSLFKLKETNKHYNSN